MWNKAASTLPKPAVKRKSPASPQAHCGRANPFGARSRLSSGLFLRATQQLDDRVDRIRLREIGSALESRLDQAADDLRAADRLAMLQPDVDGETIEIGNMTVEKNDRDFRPGLGMDNGTTAIALCRAHTHSCFAELTGKVGMSVLPSPAQVYLSVPT
ncbi:MAG TPA: hypothetical protein VF846_19040 [Thermoanaerobaculia bacterium]